MPLDPAMDQETKRKKKKKVKELGGEGRLTNDTGIHKR